jgi:CheY-like chemotaxis protein
VLNWRNISVLVVDADHAVGAVAVTMLRIIGVGTAEFVTSRQAAHEACSEQHFDVALVDLHLEGDGGIEVASSLRSASRDIVVVFMSASPRPSTLAEAAVFLPKPFETGNLNAALVRALSA